MGYVEIQMKQKDYNYIQIDDLMNKCEAVNELTNILTKEEKKLDDLNSSLKYYQKKLVIFELIRAFDIYFLFEPQNEESSLIYKHGFSEIIGEYYDNSMEKDKLPYIVSNKNVWAYANALIRICGKIRYLKRIIAFVKYNLADISMSNREIMVYIHGGSAEFEDREAFRRICNLIDEKITKPKIEKLQPELIYIKSIMAKKVERWKTNFIQYQTTPEIDQLFEKLANLHLHSDSNRDDFASDAIFGGIRYSTYIKYLIAVYAIALKHEYFCHELVRKERDISPINILTIPRDRTKLIESMAIYLDITTDDSEQILDCITLSSDNYKYHTNNINFLAVPFIKMGENLLINSVTGSMLDPVYFMNRELKRKFESDYFNAVNARESIFRKELYQIFADAIYLKRQNPIKIKSSRGKTDIDAIVYDTSSNVLALFQLKWQDVFGSSLIERNSRASNLYDSSIKWIDIIETWINETEKTKLLSKLSINTDLSPSKILIFIVSRHAVFFSGFTPDKRAAWTSAWHLLDIDQCTEFQNNKNKLEWLHKELKRKQNVILTKNMGNEEERFSIGDYNIIVKTKKND